jgi:hypothetical protein
VGQVANLRELLTRASLRRLAIGAQVVNLPYTDQNSIRATSCRKRAGRAAVINPKAGELNIAWPLALAITERPTSGDWKFV